MRRVILFAPLVIFIVLGLFLYKGLFLEPKKLESALIGKKIPAFSVESLDGKSVITEKDLIGKVSLVNFWATWCPACDAEFPYLLMYAKQNIVPIYGIDYSDDRQKALRYLKRNGDPYTLNLYDKTGKVSREFGLYGAPETYIIDHKGIVHYRFAGPIDVRVWEEELLPIIKKLKTEEANSKNKEDV